MSFAEGMPAGNQRNRFLVVHRHPGERLADIPRRSDGIRLAVRAFRIYVNQTHLHGAERIVEFTIALVALVPQPLGLGTPVDVLFGLPDIRRVRRQSRTS